MDKVTRQCMSTNHNLFEEKGEPKQYQTEVLLLTSLMPYRSAKPAHNPELKYVNMVLNVHRNRTAY